MCRPGIHRPSSSPAAIADPIHTGKKRSSVESLPTTAGAAVRVTVSVMPVPPGRVRHRHAR
ncbi:Uncharacterised protein [Mycobacterium tuberculosis]|uniref:Uncharacterized protein n=1 Tax=Mycobacterium tuberculosis TaxID=1773 RepID=A0A0U0RP04_MYCTX|nr:Uncharacterised protein [Mycobacterium tuberculosis]CKT21004.1 Uncharacterised protein [Mycobacterium tuberculosis]COW16312.1 Uncharacterised protein [Mycobacterium tuberculosis]COY44227.1 Uncharacterised protein [Mycobacterium tuberculosis]COZ04775.1 Uncharacterised protein [Mycobacterium tuberculosis]